MNNLIFRKIVNDAEKKIFDLAKKNNFLWFYNLHQREVIKSAGKLLKTYKKANRKIVLISCWLHDIAHYYAKNEKEIIKVKSKHHTTGSEIAEKFLINYKINQKEIDEIKNCIIKHRNSPPYTPKTLEEKIVAVADTLSHFESIFYLTYFKIHPKRSLEKMVEDDLKKLSRDWRDLGILPKSRKLIKRKYKVLRDLMISYGK